jgi:hypothetical protein
MNRLDKSFVAKLKTKLATKNRELTSPTRVLTIRGCQPDQRWFTVDGMATKAQP